MNADQFWQIIETVHTKSGGNMDRKCELLKEELSALGKEDLCDFIDHFDTADAGAYTWLLWAAAYVMRSGCSDDKFSDFRATLISQGRRVYERALADPDSLVDLDLGNEVDVCYEGFQYVKYDVAKAKLGEIPKCKVSFPDKPTGTDWEDDSLPELLPKLSAKYEGSGNDSRLLNKPWWKFW